jgi:hypothetical protein
MQAIGKVDRIASAEKQRNHVGIPVACGVMQRGAAPDRLMEHARIEMGSIETLAYRSPTLMAQHNLQYVDVRRLRRRKGQHVSLARGAVVED